MVSKEPLLPAGTGPPKTSLLNCIPRPLQRLTTAAGHRLTPQPSVLLPRFPSGRPEVKAPSLCLRPSEPASPYPHSPQPQRRYVPDTERVVHINLAGSPRVDYPPGPRRERRLCTGTPATREALHPRLSSVGPKVSAPDRRHLRTAPIFYAIVEMTRLFSEPR